MLAWGPKFFNHIVADLSLAAFYFNQSKYFLVMPPKRKDSKKSQKPSTPKSSWLSKFCRSNDIPENVFDVFAQTQITSKSFFTEQDLAVMGFVVGQKILISRLQQDNNEDPQASKPLPSEAPDPLPGFDLQQGLLTSGSVTLAMSQFFNREFLNFSLSLSSLILFVAILTSGWPSICLSRATPSWAESVDVDLLIRESVSPGSN